MAVATGSNVESVGIDIKEQDSDCLQTAARSFKVHRNEVRWAFRFHARLCEERWGIRNPE
jgi:hypothetical protein